MCATNKLAQLAMMRACKEDFFFWINTFVFTHDPRIDEKGGTEYGKLGSTLPFITWQFQDEAAQDMIDAIRHGRDSVIKKSRDMGATWLILMVLLWFFTFHKNKSFLILSRKQDLVDKKGNPDCMMAKLDFAFKRLPPWMRPDTDRTLLHFANNENGSVIDGESTTGDAGRGGRRTAVVPDEYASMPDGAAVDAATADVTRCRIFNSTPKGSANAFFEKVHSPHIKVISMMWWQHPVKRKGLYQVVNGQVKHLDPTYRYDPEYEYEHDGKVRSPWYDQQAKRFSHPTLLAQEIDCDFAASDFQYFDSKLLAELKAAYVRPPTAIGNLVYDLHSYEPLYFDKKTGGRLRLWMPVADGQRPNKSNTYCVGCDISTGSGSTPSVASVVCLETGEKVAEWADARTEPREFAKVVVALCRWFRGANKDGAYLIWEANGPGGSFGKGIWEYGYRYFFYRKANEKSTRKNASDTPGWYSSRETKEVLMSEYGAALKSRSFINRSQEGLDDCQLYIYHKDGTIGNAYRKNDVDPSAAKDNHGDRTIADALAWKACRELGKAMKNERLVENPPMSYGWRRKRWEAEQEAYQSWLMKEEPWLEGFM